MGQRIIRALHATLSDGSEVVQRQTADLTPEDEARLDEQRALVPKGFDSWEAFEAHMSDAYRSGRGDVEAAARLAEARAGGIVDIDALPGSAAADSGASVEQFAVWLRDESPTVDEVVEMAHGDPERARALLEAENLATGQEPRKGVEEGLTKIIEA